MIGTKNLAPHAASAGAERSVWYGGCLLTFLATGEETGGSYTLVEEYGRKGVGAEPPMHAHTREEETFYVVEGEMKFHVGGEVVPAPAGTLVVLPRGVAHRFEIVSDEVRCLNLLTPAGFEGFFRELGEPAREAALPTPEEPPDFARIASVAAKYGIEMVETNTEKERRMTANEKTGPYARGADTGSPVWFMGIRVSFLADSEETGGRFGLMEFEARKGDEPPRHIHHREDEAFYVIEGAMTCYVGEEAYEAGPGTFVLLPRGIPHSFTVETDAARVLVLVAPGGFEEFFRGSRFSEPALSPEPPTPEGPPDVAALVAEMERYGAEAVGPPGPPRQM
ncbi:MAG: quercetin 2,3-dioxygenase [Rubrobacteraceae bacterium]